LAVSASLWAVGDLRYRQHGDNLVGTNANWAARFKRIRMLFQGASSTGMTATSQRY